MVRFSKLAAGTVAAALHFLSTNSATAAPISMTMHLGGLSSPLLVNSIATALPSGITFQIVVDDTTPDTWSYPDFGLFPVNTVHLTALDLGIVDELVVTPLAYMEDSTPDERAGLSPLIPDSGAQVSFATSGQSQIGDPNLIDTIPNITGVSGQSGWSTGFSIALANGTTISNPFGSYGAAQSWLGATPISVPGPLALFSLGLVVMAAWRAKAAREAAGPGRRCRTSGLRKRTHAPIRFSLPPV